MFGRRLQSIGGSKKGFTLVEMLVVIALVSTMAFVAAGVTRLSFQKSQIGMETEQLMSTIRLAQTRSISGYQDDVWGVHISSGQYILFRGADFASRDDSYDEIHEFSNAVTAGGTSEIVFEIRTGETDDAGSVTLTHGVTGQTETITITGQGRITE